MDASIYKKQFLELLLLAYPDGLPYPEFERFVFHVNGFEYGFVIDQDDYEHFRAANPKRGFEEQLNQQDISLLKEMHIEVVTEPQEGDEQ